MIARARELAGNRAIEPDATLPDAKNDGAPRLASNDGKTTIEFPLAHTSVLADVTGNIARVEVTQLYQNPTAQRLEAVYQFPLPENAAVTDMMFRIGKRVVISEVKKRDEARRDLRARQGRRATPPRSPSRSGPICSRSRSRTSRPANRSRSSFATCTR